MAENFMTAVSAVIPMFCLIFIGILVKRYKLLNETELNHLNRMVFTSSFPS